MADVVVGVVDADHTTLEADEQVILSKNTAVDVPAGKSVGVGNVAVLTPKTGAPFKGRYMLVRITENGTQTDTVVTVKAGVTGQTPANQAALGDLALSALGDGDDKYLQLELSRFLQSDGTVRLDVAGTAGGSVAVSVVNLSKGAA